MDKRQKKKLIRIAISLCVALFIAFFQQQGLLETPKIKTTEVVTQNTPGFYEIASFEDGDTIVVNMEGKEERVRFIGIDTPETKDPRKPVQCFGHAASAFTKNLIGKNRVRLEADPINSNRDRYQRLLRYIYLPDGTLVNKKIIEEGFGFALTAFPFTKVDEFVKAQKEARKNNRGLWSACELDSSVDHNQTKPE
jgi:endonuclease YncB( thermonuclease family)